MKTQCSQNRKINTFFKNVNRNVEGLWVVPGTLQMLKKIVMRDKWENTCQGLTTGQFDTWIQFDAWIQWSLLLQLLFLTSSCPWGNVCPVASQRELPPSGQCAFLLLGSLTTTPHLSTLTGLLNHSELPIIQSSGPQPHLAWPSR